MKMKVLMAMKMAAALTIPLLLRVLTFERYHHLSLVPFWCFNAKGGEECRVSRNNIE
jgi:hypothetical protein